MTIQQVAAVRPRGKTLIGDADRQVGTFTGSVFNDGVSGTYTTADGDTGNWSWAGPAGARSLREKSEVAESTR